MTRCPRTLGSESHRYAFAWRDKLGTDPMACIGLNKWTSPRKSGGIPWVSTRFSLSIENNMQADGTRRPNLSRETKLSGANVDREIFIFSIQLTTSRIGNLTRLIHTLLYMWWPYYLLYIHTKYFLYDDDVLWRYKSMDAAVEIERNPVSKHQIQSECGEWAGQAETRGGTAEPVSRDQILRRERGQGSIDFLVLQLTTSRIGNLTLIHNILC